MRVFNKHKTLDMGEGLFNISLVVCPRRMNGSIGGNIMRKGGRL